ncbi:MAG: ATP-binding cassette domain-containing protein, partial [Arenimonas sp.]|uniref:ATP-binding cassette domain-containing protein n=1 Tax=Arenimonas sp. TaxID=1872635 RepID=UPI0025BC4C7C
MTARLALEGLEVRAGGRVLLGPINLDLRAGECLGLVGESGSGKSLSVLSLLGLLPPGLEATGTLHLDGRAITLESRQHHALRGRTIAWMPQDPQASLHPLRTVGAQLCESLRVLRRLDARSARREAIALFERLQLPEPAALLARHPHQLSGGQRQRVMLARALAGAP